MLTRRRLGSRSKRYKRRLPSILGFSFGLLVAAGAVIAVAYLHGKPTGEEENFLNSLHATLARPEVAAVAAFAALLMMAWCVRQLLFEFLAWSPGRIIVEEFAASSEGQDADAVRLTADFRDRLMRSHLQSAAPVPAPAQQGDFLDVLTTSGADPGNLFASLLCLLRAAKPTHAYEVKGALSRRAGPRPCGVTIHVVRLPGKAGPGLAIWEADWERAIARAADHATASILPRTRSCRSPWSGWRGYRMPSGLLHCYERAAEFEEERRYDEALDSYYRALRDDPMNLGLRLQIGFLQEKLALFMDALATYESILAVARPGHSHHTTRWRELVTTRRSRSDRLRRFYRSRARRDRERVLLVTQYRRAILLGGAELPRQWCKPPREHATHRDAQRAALRARLTPVLRDHFNRALASTDVEWATRPVYATTKDNGTSRRDGSHRLRKPRHERLRDRSVRRPRSVARVGTSEVHTLLEEGRDGSQLEELCVLAAVHELTDLLRQVPARPRGEVVLTRSVVELSGLCSRQRLERVVGALGGEPEPDDDADALRQLVRRIEGRRGFRRWQEHYNAACAYALPLLAHGHTPDTTKRQELVRHAVDRLERAVSCADSGFVASRRDWLLSDDPDLDGLRAEEQFKHFEAMFFPSEFRTRDRPPGLHTWELSRYTLNLLSTTAERFERTWQRRKTELAGDIEARDLVSWCELEVTAWERVRDVARHHQHWRTRVSLIELARDAGRDGGVDPPAVGFPRFGEVDTAPTERVVNDVEQWVSDNDDRLEALASVIDTAHKEIGDCPLIQDLSARRIELGRIDGTGFKLHRVEVAQVCDSHHALWRAFRKCVTDAGSAPDTMEDAVKTALRHWEDVKRRYVAAVPAAVPVERDRSPAATPRNGAPAPRREAFRRWRRTATASRTGALAGRR